MRVIRVGQHYNKPSRCLSEIAPELMATEKKKEQPTKASGMSGFGENGGFGGSAFGKKNSFGGKSEGVGKNVSLLSSSRQTGKGMSASELFGSSVFDKKASSTDETEKVRGINGGNKLPLDYVVGDSVKHIKFGMGTVISIEDAGRDFEVLVNFNTAGQKRMFASFAKLKKV